MKKKRIFGFILALAVTAGVFAAFPFVSFAAPNGKCGKYLQWALGSDGTLTISGTGEMYDYGETENAPWYASKESVKKAVIGSGVTSIGASAFEECESLVSVSIGGSVARIGKFAFYYCRALASVNIPGSVKTIGESAFEDCASISSFTVPEGVSEIGSCAFGGCGGITKFTVASGNKYYSSDGYGVLFDKNKTTLIKYPAANVRTGYLIPNSVKDVCEYAFEKTKNLKNVTFGSGVKTIGKCAFSCSGITGAALPDGLTSISCFAFEDCGSLKSATIPDSVTSVSYQVFDGTALYNDKSNWQNGVLYINKHLIEAEFGYSGECKIKSGTLTIAESAFYGRDELTRVTIPDSVKTIGQLAFYGCSAMTKLTIGSGVTSISYCAFRDCQSLKSVVIPAGVEKIESGAFEACMDLTSVLIPKTVKEIGSYAFAECYSLTSFRIPESLTKISEYTFYGCEKLGWINIPANVTEIGERAFEGCKSVLTVKIPATVKSIGAFSLGYDGVYDYMTDKIVDVKIDGFRIYSYLKSAGEKYASDNGFEFKMLLPRMSVIKGDINGDEKTDSTDYILLKRHIMKLSVLSGEYIEYADVDKDGRIDSTDCILIKRCLLGID